MGSYQYNVFLNYGIHFLLFSWSHTIPYTVRIIQTLENFNSLVLHQYWSSGNCSEAMNASAHHVSTMITIISLPDPVAIRMHPFSCFLWSRRWSRGRSRGKISVFVDNTHSEMYACHNSSFQQLKQSQNRRCGQRCIYIYF